MKLSKVLLHESMRLESGLSVLIPAARSTSTEGPHAEYLISETPLAIEDVRAALSTLRDISSLLQVLEASGAMPQDGLADAQDWLRAANDGRAE